MKLPSPGVPESETVLTWKAKERDSCHHGRTNHQVALSDGLKISAVIGCAVLVKRYHDHGI
jgi:hypothetical protein